MITSTSNDHIRMMRSLKDAKGRLSSGLFLAEGRKLCEEALRDASVHTLLVDAERQEEYAALLAAFDAPLLAAPHVVAAACDAKTTQGIVATVHMPAPLSLDNAGGPLLVLDGVQDPGNVGTMLRTAEAAGFAGALLSPQCADPFAPKTVRSSMGSVLRLPLYRGALPDALTLLASRGFEILSADLGGADVQTVSPTCPFALVIGSEGKGISPDVSALCQTRISLPMRGHAESLNAAVAAGILMYMLTQPR